MVKIPGFLKIESSKTRNLLIFSVILIVIIGLIGLYFIRTHKSTGQSEAKLSQVPDNLRFTPGAKNLSQEYLKALMKSNKLAYQHAVKTGSSVIPTFMAGGKEAQGTQAGALLTATSQTCSPKCCHLLDKKCASYQTPTNLLSQWVQQGRLSSEAAEALSKTPCHTTPIEAYQTALNGLVKKGKLTSAQSQQLLNACRKEKNLIDSDNPSADTLIGQMVQNGELSPAIAAKLYRLSDQGVSCAEYRANLQQFVEDKQITSDQSKKLGNAYCRTHPSSKKTGDLLSQIVANSGLSSSDEAKLRQLTKQNIPVSAYQAKLNQLVKEGKLTSAQAKILLAAYQKKHGAIPSSESTNKLINQLSSQGKISPAVVSDLNKLSSSNVPTSQYASELNRLVGEKKLSPEAAQKLLAAYEAEHGAVNVPEQKNENKQLVALQRRQQKQELQQQKVMLAKAASAAKASATAQQQAQQQAKMAKQMAAQQKKLANISAAMSTQAQALIRAWGPTRQTFIYAPIKESKKQKEAKKEEERRQFGKRGKARIPMIKTGSIEFAVLDTGINSDRPGPVMATIVAGKFKGAKLLGGLKLTPDNERVLVQFDSMTMPEWSNTIPIKAVAINPDTAHTALASSVNHHYLMRYASLFASGFVSGISKAITQSGSVETTPSTGDITKMYKNLNTAEKLMVGLGEVGTQFSDIAKKQFKRKPTVKVTAGVSIGILFTQPVYATQ